jgi:hypothetical protein
LCEILVIYTRSLNEKIGRKDMVMPSKLFVNSLIPAMVVVAATSPDKIVDLSGLTSQTVVSAQVCAGLLNRKGDDYNGVYTLMDEYDYDWLYDINGISDPETTDANSFIASCVSESAGYITYDYTTQQALLPSLITLASVMSAPLVESNYAVPSSAVLIFNAAEQWAGYTPLEAAQYVYNNFINSTTTLAWMNPGYDNAAKPSDPPLTKDPHLGLTDYVVKEKIFTFYLNDACIPNTDEYDFMLQLTTSNPWPRYHITFDAF